MDGIDRVDLEVEYGDGTIDRGEIWPNPDEYHYEVKFGWPR